MSYEPIGRERNDQEPELAAPANDSLSAGRIKRTRQLTPPLAGVSDGSRRAGLVYVLCLRICNLVTAPCFVGPTLYCECRHSSCAYGIVTSAWGKQSGLPEASLHPSAGRVLAASYSP